MCPKQCSPVYNLPSLSNKAGRPKGTEPYHLCGQSSSLLPMKIQQNSIPKDELSLDTYGLTQGQPNNPSICIVSPLHVAVSTKKMFLIAQQELGQHG